MRGSIQSRLFLSAGIVLIFFLSLAGFVIDKAYKKGAESALREQLLIHLYSMLGSAELSKNLNVIIPDDLPEPRFSIVDSGLQAYVYSDAGDLVWRSKSSIGLKQTPLTNILPGQKQFILKYSVSGQGYLQFHYKAILENEFKKSVPFEFVIVQSTKVLDIQIADFQSVLWKWLGGIGLFLVISQFFVLKRSLRPLRHIVADLEDIQQGNRQHLESHYSDELKDIANTLNRLIDNERTHLLRYRNTLADLAHSLKTPLSVLTGVYEKGGLVDKDVETIEKQTLMMRQLVDYQLNRAAVKGHQTFTEPVALQPIITQITDSLDKVYFEKNIKLTRHVDELSIYAEKGDMFELFGNLLDNAYKWAQAEVSIRIRLASVKNDEPSGINICIEDDGCGISDADLAKVLKRGIRADETIDGHGIGLAVVNELVGLYKGKIASEKSELGGQHWVIYLPGPVK